MPNTKALCASHGAARLHIIISSKAATRSSVGLRLCIPSKAYALTLHLSQVALPSLAAPEPVRSSLGTSTALGFRKLAAPFCGSPCNKDCTVLRQARGTLAAGNAQARFYAPYNLLLRQGDCYRTLYGVI